MRGRSEPSAWERLVIDGELPGAAATLARVERFDIFAQAARAGDGHRLAFDGHELAEEHRRRVVYWTKVMGPESFESERGGRRVASQRVLITVAALAVISGASFGLGLGAGLVTLGGSAIVSMALVIAWLTGWMSPIDDSLWARFESGRCPSCGYDLRALACPIPLTLTGGVDLGPARCPECGSAWPLVPPPVPG